MKFNITYQDFLKKGISIVQIIAYTVAFILITLSIFKSIKIYILDYNKPQLMFDDIRLTLGESCELALSFILGVEILRLFFVNTYKQLVIVITLVAIKIFISYFLEGEIKDIRNKNTKRNKNN